MAPPPSKATQLLSLPFSLGPDDSASNISQSITSSQNLDSSQDLNAYDRNQWPTGQNLTKNRVPSLSRFDPPPLDIAFQTLSPPPLAIASGVARGHNRDGSNSIPNSKMETPQTSREGSRSRPQTPSMLVPPGGSSRPSTPDSATSGKRRSWLPGKSPKSVLDQNHSEPNAWIAGLRAHVAYDLKPLLDGNKVCSHFCS
jgi:hypothetical protein